MRKLILVRHAKSDWGTEFLKDIDRPLNERGYNDAYFMSKWFLKNKILPDVILSSSAIRALSTSLIFARTFDFNMANFYLKETIYESSVSNLISLIEQQNSDIKSLMLFGHNPCITKTCNQLTTDLQLDNVPTCGIVSLKFEIESWKELSNKNGKLEFHQFPKNFTNTD